VAHFLPLPFVFTQSNLQSFLNCPYQFYLRYVLHFQWPAAQARDLLQFEADRLAGARFHQLVHQLFLGVSLPKLSQMAKTTQIHALLPGLKHLPLLSLKPCLASCFLNIPSVLP